MTSRKTPQQQEMVQTKRSAYVHDPQAISSTPSANILERRRIASPFWKTRSSSQPQQKPRGVIIDPNTVVGASYSHADMVRTTSPYTRQHVSPMLPRTSSNNRSSSSTHLTEPGGITQPNRQPYASLMAQAGEDWNHDDDGDEEELFYDDDED
ncbi:hypothetical protein ACJ72_07547, partial [Emergomyces africanus]